MLSVAVRCLLTNGTLTDSLFGWQNSWSTNTTLTDKKGVSWLMGHCPILSLNKCLSVNRTHFTAVSQTGQFNVCRWSVPSSPDNFFVSQSGIVWSTVLLAKKAVGQSAVGQETPHQCGDLFFVMLSVVACYSCCSSCSLHLINWLQSS